MLQFGCIKAEKSKNLIFQRITPFLAINKLRRSGRRNKRCIIRSKLKFTAHSLRCFSFSQKPLVFGSPERCTPSKRHKEPEHMRPMLVKFPLIRSFGICKATALLRPARTAEQKFFGALGLRVQKEQIFCKKRQKRS